MTRGKRSRGLSISAEEFEVLVQRAVDGLPEDYARLLKNVAVIVEDEPSREVLDSVGLDSEDDLLGLYSGSAIDDESFFSPGGQLPNRIFIYRGPILRYCRSPEEVVQEVRDTVVHEIGHHFGLSDDDMPY
jgi:predicted Zn-dependent protease with MMP-like domain